MILFGKTELVESNGLRTVDRGWVVSFNWRGMCWYHYSNEAGMTVIQIGPLALEWWE